MLATTSCTWNQCRVLKAFIFDIDGTLIDSNDLHVQAWDQAFRHFGKVFPIEALRAQIGKGSDQYLPEFLTPDEIARFGKELDQYRSKIFREKYRPKVRPFPKVRDLFERIRDDDKKILLDSSGKDKDTEYYIDLIGIKGLIDGYTDADDADHSKPAPDVFIACLEQYEVSPKSSIAVGDTRFDIEAAAKVNMRTIAVSCGGTDPKILRAAGAIAVYKDPADLLANYERLLSDL
jgi:phosphoglycolate phosphatase-like HAD superfamily hydrolase